MKRFYPVALLAVVLASLAFVRSGTAGQSLPPTENYTVHELIAYDTLLTGTCLGEDVHIYGTVQVTHHLTVTGNRFVEKIVHIPRGMTATGLTSGGRYNGVGVTQYTYIGSFINGQYSNSFVNVMNLLGKGRLGNLLMKDVIRVTVNADGTVASEVEHSTVECH